MDKPIESSPNRPIAVVGDIHDWNEDRPHGITRDQYWEMLLKDRIGLREPAAEQRLLGGRDPMIDGQDRQIAERRRIDAERRQVNRRANKAARAARRAGRR